MLDYLIRRIMTMMVTLVAVSVLVFIIIQLPPGDYLTTYIAELESQGELVDEVTSGRVELSDIDRDKLPEPMQAMAPAAQAKLIEETAERRNELQRQIDELTRQRADYLEKKVKESGGAEDSLDEKIYRAVKEQAGRVGLTYEADAPAY